MTGNSFHKMDKSAHLSELSAVVGVSSAEQDKRAQRTRSALIRAFNELFMERGYEDFGVAEIADRANVARSTFYQHFDGKDDVLASAASGIFKLLADTVRNPDVDPRLAIVLEHFWQFRIQARTLLGSIGKEAVVKVFAALVEANLRERTRSGTPPGIPLRLAAVQIATGQLAIIHEWLFGQYSCTAAELALAIHNSAYATARVIVRA